MRLLHGTSWTIGAAVHPDYRLLVAARCSASGKIDPNKLGAAFCLPPTPAFVTHHWPPIMLIPRQPAIETRLKSGPSVFPVCSSSRCIVRQLFDSPTQQLATAPRHYPRLN